MRRQQGGRRGASTKEPQAAAAELAIAALGFLGAEPERLGRFLALTGIAPRSIRAAAREPDFLAGVLDHIADDERLLLSFVAEHAIDPREVTRARDTLAGGRWERELP